MTEFGALLESLRRSGLAFVIVGGVAATLHGSARVTFDLDIVCERTLENLDGLVGAVAPFRPYPDEAHMFGGSYHYLDLDALIASKRAAGRPKDLEAIAELEAIRDERRSSR